MCTCDRNCDAPFVSPAAVAACLADDDGNHVDSVDRKQMRSISMKNVDVKSVCQKHITMNGSPSTTEFCTWHIPQRNKVVFSFLFRLFISRFAQWSRTMFETKYNFDRTHTHTAHSGVCLHEKRYAERRVCRSIARIGALCDDSEWRQQQQPPTVSTLITFLTRNSNRNKLICFGI